MKILTSGNSKSIFHNEQIQKNYFNQYIKLRYQIFESVHRFHYTKEPELYDLHENTSFIYIVNDSEEVIGGRRIILHIPNSGTKLKTEESIVESISIALPALGVESLTYAELGGLCLHQDYRKSNLSEKMYEWTFEMLKQLQCDFFVAEMVPQNVDRIIHNATINGVQQIVPRTEHTSIDGHNDYRIFMSFKVKEELNLS